RLNAAALMNCGRAPTMVAIFMKNAGRLRPRQFARRAIDCRTEKQSSCFLNCASAADCNRADAPSFAGRFSAPGFLIAPATAPAALGGGICSARPPNLRGHLALALWPARRTAVPFFRTPGRAE